MWKEMCQIVQHHNETKEICLTEIIPEIIFENVNYFNDKGKFFKKKIL